MIKAQMILQKLRRVTITAFREGSENTGLSMGQATLQNKRITTSLPTKTRSIPNCCLPQWTLGKLDYFPYDPCSARSPCHLSSASQKGRDAPEGAKATTAGVSSLGWAFFTPRSHLDCRLFTAWHQSMFRETEECKLERCWVPDQKAQCDHLDTVWGWTKSHSPIHYCRKARMPTDWSHYALQRSHLQPHLWALCLVQVYIQLHYYFTVDFAFSIAFKQRCSVQSALCLYKLVEHLCTWHLVWHYDQIPHCQRQSPKGNWWRRGAGSAIPIG